MKSLAWVIKHMREFPAARTALEKHPKYKELVRSIVESTWIREQTVKCMYHSTGCVLGF
jgi:hypothetical protein